MTLAGEGETMVMLRPRYEGANIRNWIGFKHFMYLAEEAVLCWFRAREMGPQRLYRDFGLGLSIVDSSVLLPAVLEVDDLVDGRVHADATAGVFTVRLSTWRGVVLRGRLTVRLRRERDAAASEPAPAWLAPLVLDTAADPPAVTAAPGFTWSWRVPYYYCQFSDRVQHGGYVRALEEVVDRFLADRGLSVGTMLAERGWIPVVSRARVRVHADAHMEETVHTVFRVTDVLKDLSFDGRMDCYVHRGDLTVPVATATILHGYAVSRGPDAGSLARLDQATIAALTAAGSMP
jgi:acyl-CoA thioesterase FadM